MESYGIQGDEAILEIPWFFSGSNILEVVGLKSASDFWKKTMHLEIHR